MFSIVSPSVAPALLCHCNGNQTQVNSIELEMGCNVKSINMK